MLTHSMRAQSGTGKAIRREGDKPERNGKVRWIMRDGKAV